MKKKELIKLLKEITVVMNRSKATFFVKDENTEIDTDEALYELKEEMITNVELHFLKLIDGLQKPALEDKVDNYILCQKCQANPCECDKQKPMTLKSDKDKITFGFNKKQLATEIVYAQDPGLDLTPEYWEKKISTLLKEQRDKYHICDQCGATAKEVDWKEYKQIKKKYNLYG